MVAYQELHDDGLHAGMLLPTPVHACPTCCPEVSAAAAQWMSGNGIHIFSIMITAMAIYNPIKTAMTVNIGAHPLPTCMRSACAQHAVPPSCLRAASELPHGVF